MAMRRCRLVLVAHSNNRIVDALRNFGISAVSIGFYWTGSTSVAAAHRAVVDRVMQETALGGPVAFAVYGHPTVLVKPTTVICDRARALGLSTRVIPGVSSIGCILAALGVDPGVSGLLVVEGRDLIARPWVLQTTVPTLVLQPGKRQDDNGGFVDSAARPCDVKKLCAPLIQAYSESHVAAVVHVADDGEADPEIRWRQLRVLTESSTDLDVASTLYVPPIRSAGR